MSGESIDGFATLQLRSYRSVGSSASCMGAAF